MGYRYQVNCKTLPGKPDVLYPPKRRLLSSFMDAIGMSMIVAVIMLIPVNPIKHIGDPSNEQSNEIKSIFRHLRLMAGKSLCCRNVR